MSYAGIFTDKNNIDHPITSTLYGTCSTAAATAAKEVVCSNVDSLEAGMTLRVVFTNANTAASPTINVNSKGAKNVYRFGSTTPIGGNSWEAGAVVDLFYDGTSFFMLNSDNLGTAAAKAATNAVTENSTDLVESGAVYTGLATKADLTDLAPAFSTATAYAVGQYVSYDGNLYKCTSAHSAGAWEAGDFTLVAVGSELESKQPKTDNNLTTTSKDTTGAINELKSGLTNVANFELINNTFYSSVESGVTVNNMSCVTKCGKHIVGDVVLGLDSDLSGSQTNLFALAYRPKNSLNTFCAAGTTAYNVKGLLYMWVSYDSGMVMVENTASLENIRDVKIHLDYYTDD